MKANVKRSNRCAYGTISPRVPQQKAPPTAMRHHPDCVCSSTRRECISTNCLWCGLNTMQCVVQNILCVNSSISRQRRPEGACGHVRDKTISEACSSWPWATILLQVRKHNHATKHHIQFKARLNEHSNFESSIYKLAVTLLQVSCARANIDFLSHVAIDGSACVLQL